jgi:hypothetical protein
MIELKVSYHAPLRKHPNIVKLHSFMWDTQSNLATALAPSLILDYADLGTEIDGTCKCESWDLSRCRRGPVILE